MTTLHGRIEEGVLANVLQYLSLGQATGRLVLRHPDRLHGSVYVQDGRIVFVDARPLYDLAALSALLQWTEGRFTFRPGVMPPRVTLDRSTETLLLEASHRADVARAPADGDVDVDIDADSVLAVAAKRSRPVHGANGASRLHTHHHALAHDVGRNGQADETVALSLGALHLWRRLDGNASLRDLAAVIGRPVGEIVTAGRELVRSGLAEFASTTVADPRFARELAREAVDLLGPVGEIVVEDALFDLGLSSDSLPVTAVDEFLAEVERGFPDLRVRREFLSRAAELRRLFALDPVDPFDTVESLGGDANDARDAADARDAGEQRYDAEPWRNR
ncbi:MAG: DUF4388 domain-containing protein [Trueperaceae bacterium]